MKKFSKIVKFSNICNTVLIFFLSIEIMFEFPINHVI